MKLFIDTTTNHVALALFDQKIEWQAIYEGKNDHTITVFERLAEIDLQTVTDIYVTSGPGSYTGVRIGVLIAKTLSSELGARLHAINTLKLSYLTTGRTTLLDARGKKYFCYDGNDYSLISYDDAADNYIIDSSYDVASLLKPEVISGFEPVTAEQLKIEYLKEAI